MADSSVDITAGSGTSIDTRTESTNGNHRQVVVLGDPATNAGVAPVDATNGLAVDVKQSALPSGAATAANQSTIIGHVDGIEGLLTTIDTDTSNLSTKIDTLAGAVSGTEMQVDVVASLPSGTNAIGKLAANSGVDIGDVDILSVIPGTGATNLGKAEDAAHSSGDTLVGIAERRIDTPASSAGTSGDYATANQSAEGAKWVTTTPTTTGGCSIFRSIDLDETEEDIKTAAGNLYGYYFYNASTSVRYLKFYNATAATVSVGTTTPVLTFPLPAESAGHVSFSFPIAFSTAICAAATTGVADSDTGAPGANEVILNVFYK